MRGYRDVGCEARMPKGLAGAIQHLFLFHTHLIAAHSDTAADLLQGCRCRRMDVSNSFGDNQRKIGEKLAIRRWRPRIEYWTTDIELLDVSTLITTLLTPGVP